MEQVSHNEFILIYWKWKWLAWWIYRMDGLLQPPVSTKLSASLIMIILAHMTGSLELWIDGCAAVSFSGVSSLLSTPGRRVDLVISTWQSAKCRSITLAKQEERTCSFVIFMSAGIGWRWGSSYSSMTFSQNLLCKYLQPQLSASSCIELFFSSIAYLEMSNDSWNHISTVTVQIYGFSLAREPFPD